MKRFDKMKKTLWFVSVFLILSVSIAFSVSQAQVRGIHLTWPENDVYHTMAISWYRMGQGTHWVYYDTKPRGGKIGEYAYKVRSEGHKISTTRSSWKATYHDAILRNLKPGTTYYFVCGGEGEWSQEHSFRTIAYNQKVKFVYAGDSRSFGSQLDGPQFPEARIQNSVVAAAQAPDFALFGGDMVMSGYKEKEWWEWLDDVPGRLVTKDGRMIPMVPVLGNHDTGYLYELGIYGDMSDYDYYRGLFALPGNELWYTLDFPNIRLIALLTASGVGFAEPGSSSSKRYDKEILQQVDFLTEQLKTADKKWIITTQHIHIVGTFPFIWNTRAHVDNWVPLFENYKVALNLAGHLHNYSRTWPIAHLELSKDFVDFVGKRWGYDYDLDPRNPDALWPKGPPIVELAHNSKDGVTYLLNGVWGAPFEWAEKGMWSRLYPWFAKAHARFSITVAEETNDNRLHIFTLPGKRPAWYGIPVMEPLDEFWLHYTTADFPPAEYNVAF